MFGKQFCVCIAMDLISSRNYASEEILISLKKSLNEKFRSRLITPFSIRKGDELIGQLKYFSDSYHALVHLFNQMELFERGVYVGIGFGTVETEELVDIDQVNGSAIRSALIARDKYLKINHQEVKLFNNTKDKKRVRYFCYSEEKRIPDDAINHLIYYIQEKIQNRTDKQRELVRVFEDNPNITYEEAGELFVYEGRGEPSISKLLQRANYHLVINAQKSLINLLDYLQDQLREGGNGI